MKIIKPSVEYFGEVPTDYYNVIKFIEKAGRTCYKSEDKITYHSAESFVKRLINAGHLAMVEHSNFVIRSRMTNYSGQLSHYISSGKGKFLNTVVDDMYLYVGGSLTAWHNFICDDTPENMFAPMRHVYNNMSTQFKAVYGELFGVDQNEDVFYWEVCPHDEIPKELHRYAVKFICDRGVSHELVRHRPCSFAQESTRYVNYAGKDMEFIQPANYDKWTNSAQAWFEKSCLSTEEAYDMLIFSRLKPQQARAILPNALKTEIITTADAEEWMHIKSLRTSKAAHPDIQRVMNMIPWEDIG